MKNKTSTWLLLLVVLTGMLCIAPVNAQVLTNTGTSPGYLGTIQIQQLVNINGRDNSNPPASYNYDYVYQLVDAPGQTFTTTGGFLLQSLAFKITGDNGGTYNGDLTLNIGTITSGTFTLLHSESVSNFFPSPNTHDYFEFDLAGSGYELAPGTTYVWALSMGPTAASYTGIDKSLGDTYAGGNAIMVDLTNGTIYQYGSQDRMFILGGVSVPEPSTYVLVGTSVVGWMAIALRRRICGNSVFVG